MFDTMETIKVVPSRPGRPCIGERFEPYVRILRNERWISVFHGVERCAKIALPTDEAGQAAAMAQATAIRDKIVSDFHDKVRDHNTMVANMKIAERKAIEERIAAENAALDREYGFASPTETASSEEVTEEAPTETASSEEVTEEAPTETASSEEVTEEAPTETQIDAPKVAARSVTRRPVRKPATPRKRGGE